MTVGGSSNRLTSYQRNTAYVGFILLVCFAAFAYLLDKVRLIIVPLIWSTFFALPLHGLIDTLEGALVRGASRGYRRWRAFRLGNDYNVKLASMQDEFLCFEAWSDSNEIVVVNNEESEQILQQVNTPCAKVCPANPMCTMFFGLCRRKVIVRNLAIADIENVPVEIVEHVQNSHPVDRLINNFAYYVVETTNMESGEASTQQ